MIGRLVAAWGLMAALAGATYADNDPMGLATVYAAMNFDGVSTKSDWVDCGEVNAYYVPSEKTVHLCNELRTAPAPFVRFVVAHELAHGVIRQLDIPFTGSEEAAADELAAYVLIGAGKSDDVAGTAYYFGTQGHPEIPIDPHPGDERRAFTLGCFALQAKGSDPAFCLGTPWPVVVRHWARLLGVGEFR